MEKTLNNVIWPCEDREQFLFFLEYLNERAICVCEQRSREQRVGTVPIRAKTRFSLALARAKRAARGFGFPTIEQRALSQISRRTDCAGAAQPCERRIHYKEYPNQLKRQIGVGNKAPQITVHNFWSLPNGMACTFYFFQPEFPGFPNKWQVDSVLKLRRKCTFVFAIAVNK